jgi:multidrug resistance efflux pump
MSSLPPIPHSAAQRWRQFRFKGVPALSFAAALIIVVILWKTTWTPTTFVGEVQSPEAVVTSVEAGLLVELTVDDLQTVTNRQVLGRVQLKSPDAASAEIAAMAADLQVMRVRMTQDQQRNDLAFQEARVELQLRRLELASAQIRLQQAESELQRVTRLFEAKVYPQGITQIRNEFGYDVAVRDRDLLRKEVEDKILVVAEQERGLEQLRPQGTPPIRTAINDAIDAAIATQEKLLKETVSAVTLRAPIAGSVKRVYRHVGENVLAGEPLIEIVSSKPERILGFLRQPIVYRPQMDELIEVRKRGSRHEVGMAKVIRVGAQLQLFTQPLRVRGFDASMERGLPVLLTVPENLPLNPGETVDLVPQKPR